jgi:hypothetical protein
LVDLLAVGYLKTTSGNVMATEMAPSRFAPSGHTDAAGDRAVPGTIMSRLGASGQAGTAPRFGAPRRGPLTEPQERTVTPIRFGTIHKNVL